MHEQAVTPATEPPLDERVLVLLRSFATASWRAGRNPTEGLERVARSFHGRVVADAMQSPRPITDRRALLDALSSPKSFAAVNGATTAFAARKLFERFGPLKVLARRTPWLVAASALPAVYTSLARGRDETALVASFLINQARHANVEPDADRVRRAAIQLLQRERVDPDAEPEHRRLVTSWIRRAVKGLLPFTRTGVTPHAKSLAAAAAAVDPATLRAIDRSDRLVDA
jgi:hypothetical protein